MRKIALFGLVMLTALLTTGLIAAPSLHANARLGDLRVTMVDAPDPVVTGERLVYVVTLKSIGGPAASINLVVVLPPGAPLMHKQVDLGPGAGTRKASCDGAPRDQVIRCAVSALGAGEYFRVRITVQAPAIGLLRSFAFVNSASRDLESRNNLATTTTSCIN